MSTRASDAARHPIQVVARRTGLSVDVIRAWEKRYEVVAPARSDTGRRLYSDADIERLEQLAHATLSGRSIKQVAALSPQALAALSRSDAATRGPRTPAVAAVPEDSAKGAAIAAAAPHLAAALDAVGRFDVLVLDAALRRAALALPVQTLIDTLIRSLHDVVCDRVRAGSLGAAHERFALGALRRALHRVVEEATSPLSSPDLVLTTLLGQPHDFGALIASATAAAEGWRAIYVGPGLPAEATADAVAQIGARALVVSLGAVTGDRVFPRELRRLRALLPRGVALLVQGTTDPHRAVLREIDAIVAPDPAALRARLRVLRDS